MGRTWRVALAVTGGVLAIVGCNAITGAGDLDTDVPDDTTEGGAAPAPPEAPPLTCGKGTKRCGDECVDASDPAFGCSATSCDRCAVPFASAVKCDDAGRCAPGACILGRGDCNGDPSDGCEADFTLPATCGACTVKCDFDELCAFGLGGCVNTCPPPTQACGGSCVDVSSSPAHCGSCTNVCPSRPNSVPTCAFSKCGIACYPGYGDCNMNPSDGCEPTKPYFVDADGDQHGAKGSPKAGEACNVPPGFSAVADDCKDDNPQVHPGQTGYFSMSYPTATGPSFDYNCNLVEEVQPTTEIGSCSPFCSRGYVKMTDAAPSLCGSTNFVTKCLGGQCYDFANRSPVACH